jgi:NADH-quinone oxidoreductase subunit A
MEHLQTLSGLNPYLPIFLVTLFGLGLGLLVSFLSLKLGPKKPNAAKLDVYECGVRAQSTAESRFSVKFYLTAILFILFDIETVFLYLWASAFDYLKWFGVIEVAIFVSTLVVGYIYVLRRKALKWDT